MFRPAVAIIMFFQSKQLRLFYIIRVTVFDEEIKISNSCWNIVPLHSVCVCVCVGEQLKIVHKVININIKIRTNEANKELNCNAQILE